MSNEEIKQPEAEVETQEEKATEAATGQETIQAEEPASDTQNEDQPGHEQQDWEEPETMEEAIAMIASLHRQLQEAQTIASQSSEKQLRLQADFDNFRKRKTREMSDAVRFANQELLIQLLPILDNFDRTLDAIEKTDNLAAVKDGIEVVNKSMRKTFKKTGLEPIESIGKTLDPEVHEVITMIPVEEEAQKGLVIDEVEKGYKLRDRVIRVAKVVVGE